MADIRRVAVVASAAVCGIGLAGCGNSVSGPHAQAPGAGATGVAQPGQLTLASLPSAGGKGGDPGNDYPYKNLPEDSRLDPWGEYVRECTSFVAWALYSRNGYSMPFYANAKDWGIRAERMGIAVNSTPAVGAVAWEQKPPYGHVAWVSAVSGSTVTIEEYNEYGNGTYDRRTVPASDFLYIHFKDLPSGAPSGTTVAAPPTSPAAPAIQAGTPATALQNAGGTIALQGGTGGTNIQNAAGTNVVQPQSPVTQAPAPGGAGGGGSSSAAAPPPASSPPPSLPVFTVQNTDNPPPDGVWFRNSPHTADTSRITGLGVYRNEQVQLQCYAWGDSVGPYNDTLWYFVKNLTRPTVGSLPDQGYLNAHYINDGKLANQVDAGVPPC